MGYKKIKCLYTNRLTSYLDNDENSRLEIFIKKKLRIEAMASSLPMDMLGGAPITKHVRHIYLKSDSIWLYASHTRLRKSHSNLLIIWLAGLHKWAQMIERAPRFLFQFFQTQDISLQFPSSQYFSTSTNICQGKSRSFTLCLSFSFMASFIP